MVTLPHTIYAYEHLNLSNNSSTRPCAAAAARPLSHQEPHSPPPPCWIAPRALRAPPNASHSDRSACACLVRAREGSPINVRGCCGAVGRSEQRQPRRGELADEAAGGRAPRNRRWQPPPIFEARAAPPPAASCQPPPLRDCRRCRWSLCLLSKQTRRPRRSR